MKIITNPDEEYAKEIREKIKDNNGFCPCRIKKTKDTKGWYASISKGSFFRGAGSLRYGDSIGTKFSYRVFVQKNWRGM
jgi:hypothetical protein